MAQPDNAPVLTAVDRDTLDGNDSVNANSMQSTIAEFNNLLRTCGFVNLVGELEEGVGILPTIDQNILKVTTEPMYSDLIPMGDQDSVNANSMQTTTAEPINLLRTYGVNLVGELEEGVSVLATFDQDDILQVTTDNMHSDLIPLDDQNMTTLVPVASSQSTETPDSWMLTPAPSTKSEDLETTLYSPLDSTVISPSMTPGYEMYSPMSAASSSSEESITLVVSPEDVLGEQLLPKRKRRRQPKSETGTCAPPRAKKARNTKVYEIVQPFEDKKMEKKRLNAVNAKKHRDLQRQNKEAMETEIEDVKNESDGLKKEVETLREKEVILTRQLEVFKNHFRKQVLSDVALLKTGQVSF